ncbi:MAG: toprim domain-containing protein, partial [Lentisphaerae bacterium]|nr:toprim domain-containing protein [Lentisphaerota bacterium]
YTENVTLVFDADDAGRKAALRAGSVFLQAGLAIRVAILPHGADPDSMLRAPDGQARFREIIDQAQSLVSFQVDTIRNTPGWTGTEGELLHAARAVLDLIRHCPGAVQQSLMIKEAAGQLGLMPDVLQKELPRRHTAAPPAPTPADSRTDQDATSRELALIEHLVAAPELSQLTRQYLPPELIRNDHCRRIAELCDQAHATSRPLLELLTDLHNDDEPLMQFAAKMLAAPPKIKSEFATNEESVKNLILALRRDAALRRRNELQQILLSHQAQPGTMTEAELRTLQEEYAELSYDVARLKSWEQALAIM